MLGFAAFKKMFNLKAHIFYISSRLVFTNCSSIFKIIENLFMVYMNANKRPDMKAREEVEFF